MYALFMKYSKDVFIKEVMLLHNIKKHGMAYWRGISSPWSQLTLQQRNHSLALHWFFNIFQIYHTKYSIPFQDMQNNTIIWKVYITLNIRWDDVSKQLKCTCNMHEWDIAIPGYERETVKELNLEFSFEREVG